ncbi:MAG: hypothetical protein ABW213_03065, partial [Tardiphaga sp.]
PAALRRASSSFNFDSNRAQWIHWETIWSHLTCPSVPQLQRACGTTMRNLSTHDGEEQIDRVTSAAIVNAIGARLRRDIPAAEEGLPGHLQSLLQELERRERNGG